MKFGLESEKFLFDINHKRPSQGVFRFIDALSDLDSEYHITNEFVLSMVEIVTSASDVTMDVLRDYILNYLMFNSIAQRESVTMVGMGALPMDYQPHMTPKWPYVIQNSILDKKLNTSFVMDKSSPLTPAGNCAGIHIHSEISTQPEYLFSTRELQDKFNLGLMLTPLIAFSSSPYFFGEHEAHSMRAQRYFNGVYHHFPQNGGLPPVMESSSDVLTFFKASSDHWVKSGVEIGIPERDLQKLVYKKGANWNPVRWNRLWNTIELRCLDSDRLDYDCSKFIWVTGAMKRLDIHGDALGCKVIRSEEKLSLKVIDLCFEVSNGEVSILSTSCINELFQLAIKEGLKNQLVEAYLQKLAKFSRVGVSRSAVPIFDILMKTLNEKTSSSQFIIEHFGSGPSIDREHALKMVSTMIERENLILKDLLSYFPETERRIDKILS